MSENVGNHINFVNFVHDASSENSSPNLEVQLRIVGLENEVKIADIRLECAPEIVSNLQTVIDYRETIMEMKNVNISHSSQLSVGGRNCDVAVVVHYFIINFSAINSKLEFQQNNKKQ
ncbi:hypothetical protein WA026_015451 [Henosepilachna vigintioctopunctata]|uniref:Uncharacterized protein n=1 Tax=Henosepilachna vigintioctopunctata TaxID=420089 RepID=A0AAW1UJP9_9CUCU